jgi:hypothetical protein
LADIDVTETESAGGGAFEPPQAASNSAASAPEMRCKRFM